MSTPIKRIEFRGAMATLNEVAKSLGIARKTLDYRIANNKTIDAHRYEHANGQPMVGRTPHKHAFNGGMYTTSEIAEMTGMKHATVRSRVAHGRPLDMPLCYHRQRGPRHAIDHIAPGCVVSTLPYEQDAVCQELIMQHGSMTLDEVGHALGVSRERVRQIQYQAMVKLLRNPRSAYFLVRSMERAEAAQELRDEQAARQRRPSRIAHSRMPVRRAS